MSMHFDSLHNRLLAVTQPHPPDGAWFATIDTTTGAVALRVPLRAAAGAEPAVPVPGLSAFDKASQVYFALGADESCAKQRVFSVDTVDMVAGVGPMLPVASEPLACDLISLECESGTGLLLAMAACEEDQESNPTALTELVRVNGTSGAFEARGDNEGTAEHPATIPTAAGMLSSVFDDVAGSYFSVFDEQEDAYPGGHLVARNVEVLSTVCGVVPDPEPLRLRCSSGTMTAIDFASFGTPEGECGSFGLGWCHSLLSKQIMEEACLGEQACVVDADIHMFGNPCVNASRWLSVQATCSGRGRNP